MDVRNPQNPQFYYFPQAESKNDQNTSNGQQGAANPGAANSVASNGQSGAANSVASNGQSGAANPIVANGHSFTANEIASMHTPVLDQLINEPILSELRCPISLDLYENPYQVGDEHGVFHTMEWSALHEILQRQGSHPITRASIVDYFQDHKTKRIAEEYKQTIVDKLIPETRKLKEEYTNLARQFRQVQAIRAEELKHFTEQVQALQVMKREWSALHAEFKAKIQEVDLKNQQITALKQRLQNSQQQPSQDSKAVLQQLHNQQEIMLSLRELRHENNEMKTQLKEIEHNQGLQVHPQAVTLFKPIPTMSPAGMDLNAQFLNVARTFQYNCVKIYLSRGANVNTKDPTTGETALMLAIQFRPADSNACDRLIKLFCNDPYRANVNLQDAHGNTALHYSVLNNDTQMTQYLLQKGANPIIRNGDSLTPLALGHKELKNSLSRKITKDLQAACLYHQQTINNAFFQPNTNNTFGLSNTHHVLTLPNAQNGVVLSGSNGFNGPNRFNGSNGFNSGAVGFNGPNGSSGSIGFNGPNGSSGSNGFNGPNGSSGPNGFNGQFGFTTPFTFANANSSNLQQGPATPLAQSPNPMQEPANPFAQSPNLTQESANPFAQSPNLMQEPANPFARSTNAGHPRATNHVPNTFFALQSNGVSNSGSPSDAKMSDDLKMRRSML